MNTSLRFLFLNRFTCLAFTACLAFSSDLHAQCLGNLLINSSFESPVVPITNGNNIMGPGNAWGGWNCTNGGLNILRVQGSGYGSGANHAANGNQYVDVANSDGYMYQQFTLTNTSPIYFSGSFSNRESGWSSYVNWTGKIDILDSIGQIVATSATRSFITTDNQEIWYTLTGSTSGLPPGKYTYRAYAGNSGHFDDAAVCALAATVLPVKLQSFTASVKGNQVISDWVVSEEERVKGYELQFSTDGVHFKALNFTTARNSNKYSSIHKDPVNGFNYYRLKTLDLDGKAYYSNICKVDFDISNTATVYPNPASGFFRLTLKDEMVKQSGSLSILNLSGRCMKQQNFSSFNQSETINISQLTPGIYFIRLTTGTATIQKTLQVVGK